MMNKKPLIILLSLGLIRFTDAMDFMIMMPLGVSIMESFQVSTAQFSFLLACYAVSSGISGIAFASIIDRFDRRTFLLLSYTGFLLATLGCGVSNHFYSLVFFRVLAGMFGGILSAQTLAIAADIFPAEKRAKAMSSIALGLSVASIAGVPAGLYIGSLWGWKMAFISICIIGIFVWIMGYFSIPSLKHNINKSNNLLHAVSNISKEKNQVKSLLMTCVFTLSHFALIPFLAVFFVKNLKLSETQVGYTYTAGGIVTLLVFPYIGKIADTIGKYKTFAVLSVLAIIPLLGIPLLQANPFSLLCAMTASSVFFTLSSSRFIPLNALISISIKPEQRGSFLSINQSFMSFMQGIISYLVGHIVVQNAQTGMLENYEIVGVLAAIFSLLSIWFAKMIQPYEGR
jgi:MFS transporter, DHA1 family, inner membrane transport protein